MGARRDGRTSAVKVFYIFDVVGGKVEEIWEDVCSNEHISQRAREFAKALVDTTYKNLKEIDKTIKAFLINWSFDRLAVVDRSILRTGVAEFMYFPDIPPKVTIDECVEIAKKYSTDKSPSFINGVLDKIAKGLKIL